MTVTRSSFHALNGNLVTMLIGKEPSPLLILDLHLPGDQVVSLEADFDEVKLWELRRFCDEAIAAVQKHDALRRTVAPTTG